MKTYLILVTTLLLGSLSLACGDDGDNNNKICGPGVTQVCACPGGSQGVQTCNITGASWSTCNCGSNPKKDAGGKVCAPGATQVCTCPGSTQGVQTCNISGASWSTCNCSGPKLDGGAVKYDKGGQPPKKSVGKFCHVLVDKKTSGAITLTMKIGTGAKQVSLSAWSNACSTVVGVQCHELPVGNNQPVEFWLQGQMVANGSASIGAGEDWIFVLDIDSAGQAKLTSGPLKTGYTCQSFNPFK
jgi:hypothetical protein